MKVRGKVTIHGLGLPGSHPFPKEDMDIQSSGEHLFLIYRRLIGRPYIALARQDKIYRNISDALGRDREAQMRPKIFEYYISQHQHITKKREKGRSK